MDDDWRATLPPDARNLVLCRITDALLRHLRASAPEGEEALRDVRAMAVRIEEKVFNTAARGSDYAWRISRKLVKIKDMHALCGKAAPIPAPQQSRSAQQQLQFNQQAGAINPQRQLVGSSREQSGLLNALRPDQPTLVRHNLPLISQIITDVRHGMNTPEQQHQDHLSDSRPMTRVQQQDATVSGQALQALSVILQVLRSMEAPEEAGWRATLPPDARHLVLCSITDALWRHLQASAPEGEEALRDVRALAARFEEKVFNAAASGTDYVWSISRKLVEIEEYAPCGKASPIPTPQVIELLGEFSVGCQRKGEERRFPVERTILPDLSTERFTASSAHLNVGSSELLQGTSVVTEKSLRRKQVWPEGCGKVTSTATMPTPVRRSSRIKKQTMPTPVRRSSRIKKQTMP